MITIFPTVKVPSNDSNSVTKILTICQEKKKEPKISSKQVQNGIRCLILAVIVSRLSNVKRLTIKIIHTLKCMFVQTNVI